MHDELQIEDFNNDAIRQDSPCPSEFLDDPISDALEEYWAAVDSCGSEWTEQDEQG